MNVPFFSRNMGKGVLLPVVVVPLLVFRDLVLFVLILHFLVALVVLVFHVELILENHLAVGFLLHGPELFLITAALVLCALVSDLLLPFSFNSLNLLWLQTLEVVSDVAAFSELRDSGLGVFSHELALNSIFDFELVLSFLVSLPILFFISLLLSKSLVFFLHLLHHILSFLSRFIFKHSSHSRNSLGLL